MQVIWFNFLTLYEKNQGSEKLSSMPKHSS